MSTNLAIRLPHKQRIDGFSLLEVLIAVVILSVALLGLAGLQLSSLQMNTNSYFRTQATIAAYDIIDRMRVNSTGTNANLYHMPNVPAVSAMVTAYRQCGDDGACDCETNSCDTTNLALYDKGKWYDLIIATLPGAETNPPTIFHPAGTNEATVQIQWSEKGELRTASWTVRL
jgi:type IV pilus assembly protein PilV